MKLDPAVYNLESQTLMQQRGILIGDEGIDEALTRTTAALLEIDTELSGFTDDEFGDRVYGFVESGVFVFGTPLLANAGRRDKVTAACTVLPIHVRQGKVVIDRFYSDSENALGNAIGTGYDLSEVDDPVGTLEELNEILDKINLSLVGEHKRPVASMATLRADHPEVMSFIRAKRNVDFSAWRFNISLFVTEELFNKALADELWELKNSNGESAGFISAKSLLDEIAESAHYCGEPGILFKDRIDIDNPTPQWEYKSTAPCAEVSMAEGEACQFSYINLGSLVSFDSIGSAFFDEDRFGQAVADMTRILDASVEQTVRNAQELNLPLVQEKRRVGVGITGFADLLIHLGIPYDDPSSPMLAARISEQLDYHSKQASMLLAKSRSPFPAYPDSRYNDSAWARRKLVLSTGAISVAAWEALHEEIQTFGLRNAATTSLPPTGTSSTIVHSSKSLEPHFTLTTSQGNLYPSVSRALDRLPEHVVPLDVTSEEFAILVGGISQSVPYLRTAREINPHSHLQVQAAFQSFLDESLAKTVNMPNDSTVEDVMAVLVSAHDMGVKGITVFRDQCLSERTTS